MSKEANEEDPFERAPHPIETIDDNVVVADVLKQFQSEPAGSVDVNPDSQIAFLKEEELLNTAKSTRTKLLWGPEKHIAAVSAAATGFPDGLVVEEDKVVPHSIRTKAKKQKGKKRQTRRSLKDIPPEQRVYIDGNPGEFDVVGGRGGSHDHRGNMLYNIKAVEIKLDEMKSVDELLTTNEPETIRSKKVMQLKANSVERLIAFVAPERFLDKDDEDDKGWFILPPKTVRNKVQQTFRDLNRLSRDELLQRQDDQLDKLPRDEHSAKEFWTGVSCGNDLDLLKDFE